MEGKEVRDAKMGLGLVFLLVWGVQGALGNTQGLSKPIFRFIYPNKLQELSQGSWNLVQCLEIPGVFQK